MKRAVLCGYYGMGNGGDEALLVTLLKMLPANIQPIVLSNTPAATVARYKVLRPDITAIDRWDFGKILVALRSADAFVWGGGSLIQDSSSPMSPLYYLGLMQLAQWLGLKTIAWAQGIGPIQRRYTQTLTRRLLQRCLAVSVRDRGSSDWLTRWGIAHTLAPDPVWALPHGQTPPPRAATTATTTQAAPLTVAVNLRQHSSLTDARLYCLSQALVQFQQQTQAQILLVPFQASLDLALAETLHRQLEKSSRIVQLEDPAELQQVFTQVDVAIVMRLHAFIMAAAAGCRCLALSYDPKVTYIATNLNLPVWEMATLTDDVGTIVQDWQNLIEGRSLTVAERQNLADQARQHQQLLQLLL
jgi:polysaccharide pyruvyl transferase CsaB